MSDDTNQGGGGGRMPFVHPGAPQRAVDQAAVFSAAKQARRSANPLPKTNTPVAGGPAPQIPHLAGAPQHDGMTMAQHAAAERGQPVPGQVQPQPQGGFVEPAVVGQNQIPPGPAQLGILPTDELPKEASQDPEFISGTGSMFAASQPKLAMKYGVIRRGRHVPPQQLQGQQQPTQLRPETLNDLQELAALQKRQEQQAVGADASEPTEMGEASGTVGTTPVGAGAPALSEEEKGELKEALSNLDDFDFDRWRQSQVRDILNNEEQRQIIEARLQPMSVEDLVVQGYCIQKVPIIPGRFWVEFKTLEGETDLALKRLIMEDSASVEVSERYYYDKFGLMSVTAVVHKINDRPYGDFVDAEGNFDDELFRKKFKKILKLPAPMLSSLGVNAFWFDMRVRQLFVAEKLGNG